jgi:predicted kinase
VVVTGPPATGKTTLAQRLSRDLGLPLAAKDAIKERLYDTLGAGDREWSRRLGRATFELMFHWLAEELRAGRSIVAEANFTAAAVPRFAALPSHRVLQLFCTAPRDVVVERYAARTRHHGHLDDVVLEELRAGRHEEQWRPLELGGEVVELRIESADVDAIVARARALLHGGIAPGTPALQ